MVLGEYLDILLPFNALLPNPALAGAGAELSIDNSVDLFRVGFRGGEVGGYLGWGGILGNHSLKVEQEVQACPLHNKNLCQNCKIGCMGLRGSIPKRITVLKFNFEFTGLFSKRCL